MPFNTWVNANPLYQQTFQTGAVTFQWAAERLMEYFNLAPNKASFAARKITHGGPQITQDVVQACQQALPALVPPIGRNTQLLAAGAAVGARLLDGNALLNGLSQYADTLLQAGQLAYTNRLAALRQTYMPTDRHGFIAEVYGMTGCDAITTVHLRSFLDLLEWRIAPYRADWGHGFNATNQLHVKATKTQTEISIARAALPADANAVFFDAWLQSRTWGAKIEAECAYWATEIPIFRRRLARWQLMAQAAGAGPGVTVKRNVTQGEADSIRTDRGLRQGPGSFEKHKFFGGPQSAPGNGVTHPIVLTIVLKQGVYEWLQANSTEGAPTGTAIDYGFASFFKSAEPHCYGIHEDALGIFNTLIHQISIAKAPGQQINYQPTAPFAPGFVPTYPNDYHFPT